MLFWSFQNQWTGIDAINIFSNRILTKMGASNPTFGAMIIGSSNFFFSLLAYLPLKYFEKKTILWYSHLLMSVIWVGVAVAASKGSSEWVIILIFLFIAIF